MRTAFNVVWTLCAVVAFVLVLAVMLVTAVQVGGRAVVPTVLGVTGAAGQLVIAAALFSLTVTWDVRSSADGRTLLRRWIVAAIFTEIVASAFIVFWALAVSAPGFVPVLFITVGLGAAALAPVLGVAVFRLAGGSGSGSSGGHLADRYVRSGPVLPSDPGPLDPRPALLTMVAVCVACLVGFVVVPLVSRGDSGLIPVGAQFALLFGGVAGICWSLVLSRRVQRELTLDIGLIRQIRRMVLKNAVVPDDYAVRRMTSRWARDVPALYAVQVPAMTLIVSHAFIPALRLTRDSPDVAWWLVAALIAALAVTVGFAARDVSRARRYAAQNPITA